MFKISSFTDGLKTKIFHMKFLITANGIFKKYFQTDFLGVSLYC